MSEHYDTQEPPTRQANGQFGPGNPGKPKGATNLAGRQATQAFLEDFDANRGEFLRRLRDQFPIEYARMVTKIMPEPEPEYETSHRRTFAEWSPGLRYHACRRAREVLDSKADPFDVLTWLELILDGNIYREVGPHMRVGERP